MSRMLFPDKVENEIRNLIDQIYKTLVAQYKHWQKYGIITGYPNFLALQTGFKLLEVRVTKEAKWIFLYNKKYIGMINVSSLEKDTLFIIKTDTKELNDGVKKIHYRSTVSLLDFFK